ncbi:MAG TPA: hypothetical protein VND23_06035, partial [Acidimicrobiales bacterium]|nr:hypothetical protein [Acidimicrobiales bacterium]
MTAVLFSNLEVRRTWDTGERACQIGECQIGARRCRRVGNDIAMDSLEHDERPWGSYTVIS